MMDGFLQMVNMAGDAIEQGSELKEAGEKDNKGLKKGAAGGKGEKDDEDEEFAAGGKGGEEGNEEEEENFEDEEVNGSCCVPVKKSEAKNKNRAHRDSIHKEDHEQDALEKFLHQVKSGWEHTVLGYFPTNASADSEDLKKYNLVCLAAPAQLALLSSLIIIALTLSLSCTK